MLATSLKKFGHRAEINAVTKMVQVCCLYFFMVFALSCRNNKSAETKRQKENSDSVVQNIPAKTIVFFGNSLTAGYGVEPSQAFPALIQKKIDSLHLPYKVVNAGVSGETTAGGLSRIEWILQQPLNVFVLELGANDGLRGLPVAETEKNLQAIIDKVKEKYPVAKLLLAGMQVPPSMGQQYSKDFKAIYPDLAKKNNVILIPFLLQGVGGEVNLNQEDGIHPNEEGHKILAENVWDKLKEVVE